MNRIETKRIVLMLVMLVAGIACTYASFPFTEDNNGHTVKNVLFIGDSQTGWMGERLTAYGVENGFEVATITWDGATPQKYANSGKLPSLIATYKPDVVFINLGMNALLEPNPEKALGPTMAKFKRALGNIPFVWVGPLSWPGKPSGHKLVSYLKRTVESAPNGHFYDATPESIPRQSKSNPHPTRPGASLLVDHIVTWLPSTGIAFPSLDKPRGEQMKRGKTFIYRRMNQSL
jgi:hypothetical protein